MLLLVREWALGQADCVIGAVASYISILASYQLLETRMVELGFEMTESSKNFDKRDRGFHSKISSVGGNVTGSVGAPVAF